MIAMLLLAAQAPAGTPASWTPANQLSCSMLGPIDQSPTTFDLDLTSRKTAAAVVSAGDGPFARIGSTSPALIPAGEPARLIGLATGAAQYRLVLKPAAGNGARLQVFALADGVAGDLVTQGFCTTRGGKPLVPRKLAALAATNGTTATPAWTLKPLAQRLPDRSCVLVDDDRRTRTLSYTVTPVADNELTIAYQADSPDILGVASASAGGAQFYLVSPARRMVSVTTMITTADPPVVVHIAFERSGTWIDVSRGQRIVAVGACGTALPILVGPPIGAVSP